MHIYTKHKSIHNWYPVFVQQGTKILWTTEIYFCTTICLNFLIPKIIAYPTLIILGLEIECDLIKSIKIFILNNQYTRSMFSFGVKFCVKKKNCFWGCKLQPLQRLFLENFQGFWTSLPNLQDLFLHEVVK
jgi:hypothetical protein